MKKYILSILFFLAAVCLLNAQSHVDALRYSQHSIGGTARSVGMSGAFGALGGDFSSLSSNPAGLGVYRGSEFTFTPEFHFNNTTTRYQGETNEEGKFNFNFSNLGYVANFNVNNNVVKSVNFGIGFNRLANFNRSYVISGVNNKSSLGDYMADVANNSYEIYEGYAAFTAGLFYDAEVLYSDDLGFYLNNGEEGYFDINNSFIPTRQRILVEESGRLSERTFSFGINLGDVFYVGTTFGWHKIIRNIESVWSEEEDPLQPGDIYYEYFDFKEDLKVRGDGYTGKIGAIFTPIKELRVGAAFHLPVYYSIKEEYKTSISSRYIGWDTYKPLDTDGYELDYFESSYEINSPAKFVGSIASIIGGFFIVSADLEYLDYSSMKMKPVLDYDADNQLIKLIYKDAMNIKVGSEVKFDQMYVRGGIGFYGSPYQSQEENSDAWRLSYSCGLGYRNKNFFMDIAYQYMTSDERQILYSVDNVGVSDTPTANIDTKTFRVMTTIGFRF